MSSDGFAAPQCFIDIYPLEGGPYSFRGGQVISAVTDKYIKGDRGTFSIRLAPEALANNLSWSQILTPMSLVVIGMKRGSKSAITMIGVINLVEEQQSWASSGNNQVVTRYINISGSDLSYFFTFADYYSLWLLTAKGQNSTAGLAAGLLTGDPGDVAKTWYKQVMSDGVFKDTAVMYKNSPVKFASLFGTQFDNYKVTIPYGDYFLGTNTSWIERFRNILQFPFYEFFVTTNSNVAYPGASAGTEMQTEGFGDKVTGSPVVIGRMNPVPALVTSLKGVLPSFDSIDVSKWNALPNFDTDGVGFIESSIRFTDDNNMNFFNINFPFGTGLNGASNSNFTLPIFNYASAGDLAAINRYGYRPMSVSTNWFADIAGDVAKKSSDPQTDNQKTFVTLLGQVAGYYEALGLMADAEVTYWLRPDIQIGTKFSYNPYRFVESWDFYVERVRHEYIFNGQSTTQLGLSRGLPSSVYEDTGTGGLLFSIHTGNAQRVGGEFKVGLPSGSAKALEGIGVDKFAQWILQINKLFVTPQATQQAP